jgi:enoyl-CoA hydratase/carnithine racemase
MNEALAGAPLEAHGPLTSEAAGGILRLTLANPPANPLSLEAMEALQGELDRARDNDAVRVIVIAHLGKVFSAGHNLKQMAGHRGDADKGRAFFEHTFAVCSRLMQSVVSHPKPVIAEIDGIATAAGCQLVASCDLAVASDRSTFGVNGIDVGLFCHTPAVALSRNVSRKQAMEMLLTGGMIDAETALAKGLVSRVVAPEALRETVNGLAHTIAAKPPSVVSMGKKAFYEQVAMDLPQAYEHQSRVIVENMLAPDAVEGIDAFVGKRKPQWREE